MLMQTNKHKIVLTEADILRRLQQSQVTKQSQFIKIIKNLRAQGQRLSQDLQMLKEKVIELKQRYKKKLQQQNKRIRNDPKKKYADIRQELNSKYQQLLIWQKKSQKSKEKLAIQVQYRDYINKCMSLQIQIQTQLKMLRIQKKNYKRLKKILKAQQKQEFHILRKPTQIQQFNKQLKQKISTMKKIIASQNNSQIQIHSHKIEMNLKQKQKKGKLKLLFDKYEFYTQISQQKTEQGQQQEQQQKSSSSQNSSKKHIPSEGQQKQNQKQKQISSSNQYQTIKKRIYSQMNRHQILQLSNHLKQQFNKLQNQISSIQQRIVNNVQKNKIDPNYRRKGAQITWVKQRQILLNKNKVLMQNLKQLDQKKIKVLLDLKTHQKYYKYQQVKEINQLNNSKMRMSMSKYKKNSMKTQVLEQQPKEANQNNNIKEMNRSKSQMKFNHRNRNPSGNGSGNSNIKPIKKQNLLRLKTSINSHQSLHIDDQIKTQRSQKKRKVSFNLNAKKIKPMKNSQTQTKSHLLYENNEQFYNEKNEKVDFVGSLLYNHLDFDDRIINEGLTPGIKMCIQQLSVYVCNKGISSIKAKYKQFPYQKKKDQQHQPLQVESFHNIQSNINPNSKLFQTNLPMNDHVKLIKLLYSKKFQTIKKIQIISKLNIRYQFGSQQSHFPSSMDRGLKINVDEITMTLDIGKNDYPSFLMGNYKNLGTINVLSGLAVQINQEKI